MLESIISLSSSINTCGVVVNDGSVCNNIIPWVFFATALTRLTVGEYCSSTISNINPLYVLSVGVVFTWFCVCSKANKLLFNGVSWGGVLLHFFKYLSNEFNKFIILSNGFFTVDIAKLIALIVDLVFIT